MSPFKQKKKQQREGDLNCDLSLFSPPHTFKLETLWNRATDAYSYLKAQLGAENLRLWQAVSLRKMSVSGRISGELGLLEVSV